MVVVADVVARLRTLAVVGAVVRLRTLAVVDGNLLEKRRNL
jgi:hypothetical protein